jgi:basic membrane protein A and related proteins
MRSFRTTAIALVTVALLAVPVTTSLAAGRSKGSVTRPAASTRVGLAIINGVNDKGFNQLAYKGLKTAESRLGVKGTYTVTLQGSDYVGALNTFVSQKYNFIVAVGALWDNAVFQVASVHPKLHFAIVDGSPVDNSNRPAHLANVASLFFRTEQPGYVVGVLAGLMEKDKIGAATHNTIAALGAYPGLDFIDGEMCGYYEGARHVDKTIRVVTAYAFSFDDQSKGNSIGQTQISNDKADILLGVANAAGLGYYQAAKAYGKYAIGFAADQDNLGTQMLTSAVIRINLAVFRIIQAQAQGKFKAGAHYFSIKNGGLGYGTDHMHHVPAKIKSQVAAIAGKVAAGKVTVSSKCNLPS